MGPPQAPVAPAFVAPPAPPAVAPAFVAPAPAPAVSPAARKGATEAVGIVSEVACPSCGMLTMATPGVVSVCFSCGQPIDASKPAAAQPRAPESYALTGAMPEAPSMPANPYAKPGIGLVGEGRETRVSSAEMGVGRDPARCGILLAEPRVSGLHATVKLDGGLLHVRDEGSNNGTFVDGSRIVAHVWVPVRTGAELRFGPVSFAVTP